MFLFIVYIIFAMIIIFILVLFTSEKQNNINIADIIFINSYIHSSNLNKYKNKVKYTPCNSCGLGNKLLGLISAIAYGFTYSYSLKVKGWDSLWWYFDFPLKLDRRMHKYNKTFTGHFYFVKTVIENVKTRNIFIKKGIITYNKRITLMMNELAYKISHYFLKVNASIIAKLKYFSSVKIDYGIHIRTGSADGKEYLLHYLTYNDVNKILNYIINIHNNNSIYISSDSLKVKLKLKNRMGKIFFTKSTQCNSGYGLLKINNSCAVEAIIDYYILSKCKYLILTRCSSFSLVSLFANKIGYDINNKYKYFGNCTIHLDMFS